MNDPGIKAADKDKIMETTESYEDFAFEDADLPPGIALNSTEPVTIPVEAYISADYARAEEHKLWGKAWQVACREEEIPRVGDFVTYDIMNQSVIVVRTAEDEIRAYHNTCQHRGRQLVAGCGHAQQFVCRFHGWRWNIGGECTFVNDRKAWDGCLTAENTRLERVRADCWGGWVWINLDPDAEPLLDYLAPAVRLLGPYELDRMRYRWRQRIVMACNWKTALEAFSESHHAAITHPQLNRWGVAPFYQCHTEGKHAWHGPAIDSGVREPGAMNPSKVAVGAQAAMDHRRAVAEQQHALMTGVNATTTDTFVAAADRLERELPDGSTMEAVVAHLNMSAERDDAARGVIWPKIPADVVMAAGHDWHLFPNSVILQNITHALCYRARPNGADPDSCIFEVYSLERYPEGTEPETRWELVSDPGDERWPQVLRQDFENMPAVQAGMKSFGFKGARPNPRQEVAVTHFHRILSRYMGRGAPHTIG